MHKDLSIDKNHEKKRPETVEYYNKTKAGFDVLDQMSRYHQIRSNQMSCIRSNQIKCLVLDQMSRYHTCKSATRRWPVACFFYIFDCACINAFICSLSIKKLPKVQFQEDNFF